MVLGAQDPHAGPEALEGTFRQLDVLCSGLELLFEDCSRPRRTAHHDHRVITCLTGTAQRAGIDGFAPSGCRARACRRSILLVAGSGSRRDAAASASTGALLSSLTLECSFDLALPNVTLHGEWACRARWQF